VNGRRSLSIAGIATLSVSLLAIGLPGLSFVGGSAATAAVGTTEVHPYLEIAHKHFKSVPTTAECVADIGLPCYSPQQFQAAYDMGPLYDQGLNGAGKTIVLVDSFGSPTARADLNTFDKAFGLPAPPSFRILRPAGPVPKFDPNNSTMVGWAEETSLDIEYSHAMAPGANIDLVETPVAETEGLNGIPQIVHAENNIINRGIGDVISQSFGATENTFPSKQSLLHQRSAYFNAAAHDVTVLGSSGDDGVTDDSNNAGTLLYTHRVNSWPSSDPLVTSVGGTQLHLDANGNRLLPDNVWNDTNVLGSPAAGGGGNSNVFRRPPFQNSVKNVVGGWRGTPDVSMSAAVDGAALVYLGSFESSPGFYLFGGTSEASPLFSGVVAIADQAAGHDLGDLNPTLYSLASQDAPGLVDVTGGNNTVTFSQWNRTWTVPGYLAGTGYDMASGLGTVDGAQLVSELAPTSDAAKTAARKH
jgi:subtilase family serine protease